MLDKIKNHVRDNQKAYVVGGVCFVAGVAVSAVVLKKADLEISPKIQQILSYKPHATLEVHIEALGDPGNIIQDVTTGTIYASQGQAARELGINAGRISEQLKGAREHVNGHVFEKLAKASVSEV